MSDPDQKPRGRRGSKRRRGGDVAADGAVAAEQPSTAAFGDTYAPLQTTQLEQISDAVLAILETIGLSESPPVVIDTVCASGGQLGEDGRLRFPRHLTQAALQGVCKSVTLCGQDAKHDMIVEGARVYTGSGGAAPRVIDIDSGRYRESTLKDLYDAARLADALDHIHFFSRSLVARDLEDEFTLDVNTAFACLAGTAKHVMVSASQPEHVRPIAEMCYRIAGSEQAFRERPFLSFNINHVVPPLRFHAESCEVMVEAIRAGFPVMVNVFGQLGASSPVTVAGSVAQTVAESLAGVIFAWLIDADAAIVGGPRAMITDLRTGGFSGGSGEQALTAAIAARMMRHYGLPNSAIAGATDSKLADAQAGYEKALTVTLAVQAGVNLVTQACGMHAGLMGVSFESYVIDNDMLGSILRANVPVEVSETTLALETVAGVVAGEGHFLGESETYARMKTDFLYPDIADRTTPDEWQAAGAHDIREVALNKARSILASHFPAHLDADMRDALRAMHDIRLHEKDMGVREE